MDAFELKVPPPVVMGIIAVGMWLTAAVLPGAGRGFPGRGALAACLALVGVATAAAGVRAFVRHGTTPNPMAPEEASALVRDGVYRFTRNPMYLGLAIILIGWGIWLGSWWAVVLIPVYVGWVTRFQVIPEERVLRARFGGDYEEYTAKVRRWI